VGPADEEEDVTVYGQRGVMPADEGDELDEWFAFLAMDPAEDDDWLWSVMPDLDGNDGDGQAASSELEDLVPLGMTTTKGQKDLSPVDPTEDDDGRCGDATPGEVALGEKGDRFAPETGDDFIALDPVEDADAVPGEFEEDYMAYSQRGGVILNEVTLHGQLASSVEEDFTPLDPTEDDDTSRIFFDLGTVAFLLLFSN